MNDTATSDWKNKTCEGCYYAVGNRCRRALSSYGYPQIVNHGRYQLACSFYQPETKEKPCEGVTKKG